MPPFRSPLKKPKPKPAPPSWMTVLTKFLLVAGLLVLAAALRSCRTACTRKLGAVVILATTFLVFKFLFHSVIAGVIGVTLWFFLPWIELLTRIRRLRLPLNNRLRYSNPPADSQFPHAPEAIDAIEESGFEHATDSAWEWGGMKQYFRIFWHPEERAVATVCLCEQDEVAFAFLSITSRDGDGNIWRTTNFPFSPTLKCNPEINWNHVPCEKSCFMMIMQDHLAFLRRRGVEEHSLRIPDPDEIEEDIEREMREQIDHNLDRGIIELTGDGHFRYSKKGLLFLWRQYIKDMVRLC